MRAEDQTVTWAATSGALGSSTGTGCISIGNFQWNYERTLISGTSYTGWTSNCIQLGKNGGVENITFSTANIPGTIKKVSVECSSYNNAHKLSITVGGTSYLSNASTAKWTTVSALEGTGNSSGEIVVSFTDGTRALYVKSISVTYDASQSWTSTHELSTSVYPSNAGTVSLEETSLEEGETTTATAIPTNSHFTFTSWSIIGEGTTLSSTTVNPTTVTMGSENATITANFTEDSKYDVTYYANDGSNNSLIKSYYENDNLSNINGFIRGWVIQWSCQTENGSVTTCSYSRWCRTWDYKKEVSPHTHYNSGTLCTWSHMHINNNIIPSESRDYSYNSTKTNICTFSCDINWSDWDSSYIRDNTNKTCINVCNQNRTWSNKTTRDRTHGCNYSTYITWDITRTNNFSYSCKYENKDYKCEMKCPNWQIYWPNGCEDKKEVDEICNVKYNCTQWILANTWETCDSYTWTCKDINNKTLANCTISKTTVSKKICYNSRYDTQWFYIVYTTYWRTAPVKVTIHQWKNNWEDLFNINIWATSSQEIKYINQNQITDTQYADKYCQTWSDTIYEFEIDKNCGTVELCTHSCDTIWQCANGATSSNLVSNSTTTWATFTRKCNTQNCSIDCSVKWNRCTTMPSTWYTTCDEGIDDCELLKKSELNLSNFYIDSSNIISSNSLGQKRHCVKSWSQIICEWMKLGDPRTWFKCKDWYVQSGCDCVTTNPCNEELWTCNMWTATYSWQTLTNNYNYQCNVNWTIYSCTSSCPSWKYWWWSSKKCISAPELCKSNHYNCNLWALKPSTNENKSGHQYTWFCKSWDVTSPTCRECYTWYVLSWTTCIAWTLWCSGEKWGTTYNLNHWESTQISQNLTNTIEYTTWTCNNGSMTRTDPITQSVCNTGSSNNPWKCYIWTATGYNWNWWSSKYTYNCIKDGIRFTCNGTCNSGYYRSWWVNKCLIERDICSDSHYNCKNWWNFKTNSDSYAKPYYSWTCTLWNITKNCTETEPTPENVSCNAETKNQYNLKVTSDWQTITAVKYKVNQKCTQKFKCNNGTWELTWSESCINVCPTSSQNTATCNTWEVINPDWATWLNNFSYTCLVDDQEFECNINCTTDKYWNWNNCVTSSEEICSPRHYNCNIWISSRTNTNEWWYYRKCIDWNNNEFDTENKDNRCYECNNWYHWDDNSHQCIINSCQWSQPSYTNCSSVTPSNNTTNRYVWTNINTACSCICKDWFYKSWNNCIPSSCSYNGKTYNSGSKINAYTVSSVACGNTCSTSEFTCKNSEWYLWSTKTTPIANCSVNKCSCSYNWTTYNHWQTINAYTTDSVPCGNTCSTTTFTCNDGNWQ